MIAVTLRLVSLVLIVAALFMLGADALTSLEKGGQLTVRSLAQVWTTIDATGFAAFKTSLAANLPGGVAKSIQSLFLLPGWGVTGVLGVVLAFLSGHQRKH